MKNIAIDGPAGAGKSTIAKLAAKELGFIYVDTGSMYRAMALACIRQGVKPEEEEKVTKVCQSVQVSIEYKDGQQIVLLNGENVNPYIRTEEVGKMTSAIAVYQGVREKLLELQRDLAKKADVIMDGRDIGTCVLPDADVKIFMTASSVTRARRRYTELKEKGIECNIEDIEKDIIERDERDSNRKIAPLRQAEDAIVIDSSNMSVEESVAAVIKLVKGA